MSTIKNIETKIIMCYYVVGDSMGKFDYVLLASDFDGTLTDSQGIIPERNKAALEYFISEGGRFSVSTGRTKKGFHRYNESFINAPVILGNGAMAFDYNAQRVIFTNAISAEDADIVRRIYKENAPLSMEIYSVVHKTYVLTPNEASIRHFSGLQIDDYKIIDSIEEDIFPLVKIMLSVGSRTYEVQDYLRNNSMGNMQYIPCDGSFIEILSEKAGKGRALLQLADYYGIKHCDAYAVGDGSNDVDMLKASSIGFVPSSGDRLAKAVADRIVCSSDEGAVADVITALDAIY